MVSMANRNSVSSLPRRIPQPTCVAHSRKHQVCFDAQIRTVKLAYRSLHGWLPQLDCARSRCAMNIGGNSSMWRNIMVKWKKIQLLRRALSYRRSSICTSAPVRRATGEVTRGMGREGRTWIVGLVVRLLGRVTMWSLNGMRGRLIRSSAGNYCLNSL